LAGGAIVALTGAWQAWAPRPVHAITVRPGPFAERVVASGRVLAAAEVHLGALRLGQVARVAVELGQPVRAGEVLVELAAGEAAASLRQAEAALAEAEASLAQVHEVNGAVAVSRREATEAHYGTAQREFERSQQLVAAGAATQMDLEQAARGLAAARAERDAARAQALATATGGSETRVATAALAQARARLDLAQAQREQLRIRAPSAGIVLVRQVEVGDVVTPGQLLLVLAADGPTCVAVQIDETQVGRLTPGQAASVSAEAYPDQQFAAHLATVSPGVDLARGTVEVRLSVPAPPAYLRPNMTVSVNLETCRLEDALVIPAAALHDGDTAAPWVLVIADGAARRRPVQLGPRAGDALRVQQGLAAGDLVIVDATVSEGTRVRPEPVAAP
jgi:HlyD family secretion protein